MLLKGIVTGVIDPALFVNLNCLDTWWINQKNSASNSSGVLSGACHPPPPVPRNHFFYFKPGRFSSTDYLGFSVRTCGHWKVLSL
jgi:hypothetical protein